MKKIIILLAVSFLVSSCVTPNLQLVRKELELKEYVLNTELSMMPAVLKTGTTWYVSFSNQRNEMPNRSTYIDPPKEFINRFANRPYTVKTISQCPKDNPHAIDTNSPPYFIMIVEIVEWQSDTSAKVKTDLRKRPIHGGGMMIWELEKVNGKWTYKRAIPKAMY